ncbi:MAG: DUF2523 domain-containing protein [Candidatus Hydrogenedentes bacterium]|nr:DUF2523 domain-containing protein [Candidatus Hydrogenedentota bacterium]
MAIPFVTGFFRFLPWLFAGIVALAPTIMPALIRIAALTLGIGVVTFVGMGQLFDYVLDRVDSQIGGMPAQLAALVEYMGVFSAIQIVTAAVSIRIAMMAIGGGSLSRYRLGTKIPPVFKDL